MMKESRLSYHAVPRIVQDKLGLPKGLTEKYNVNKDFDIKDDERTNETHDKKEEKQCGNDQCASNLNQSESNSATSTSMLDQETEDNVNRKIASSLECMEWKEYEDYMRTCRINMNVRQVLSQGQTFPEEKPSEEEERQSKKAKIS